jgi:assimilatory nitrate reductase catalytic subunit
VDRAFVDAHTEGFEAFAGFVVNFTPERACAAAEIDRADFDRAVEVIATGKRVSFWWTMGVNQGHESTRTAQALINLALMTGNIGRPGTGANSITGQCNAMGSRLYANATSMLGGRDFTEPEQRRRVAADLGMDPGCVPDQPSWAYDQIIDGIERGDIRGLWVIATNSSHSWIDGGRLDRLLDKLEFLVVQDLYPTTDTARRAHLILPAAGWGEKEGTLINSERRIGRVKKVRRAPGVALSDFAIFRLVAAAWGCGSQFAEWSSPEAVFQVLKRLSAGQPCDMTGIRDYAHLDQAGGIQWPWSRESAGENGTREPAKERRLFEDGRFPTRDGRARFLFDPPRGVAEPTDDDYPFVLLTGRGSSAQWHTNTRTSKSEVLRRLYPAEAYVELNPEDATRLGIRPHSQVVVSTRRGSIRVNAFVTPTVRPGHLFLPMHYEGVNRLTAAAFDPHSRQPSYKHCAAALERV